MRKYIVSMNYSLRGPIPGYGNSRFEDVAWPARSPHIEMRVIFLSWEKSKVFATKFNTITELKDCIWNEVDAKPTSVIRRVMANVALRLQTCVEVRGGHQSNVIFHN